MRTSFRTTVGLFSLALAAACGGHTGEGSDTITECIDGRPRALGDAEASELGFSGAEVLAYAGAAREHPLLRAGADGQALSASIELRGVPGSVRFVPSALNHEVSEPDPCRGRIEQDVQVDLRVGLPVGEELRMTAMGRLHADSLHRARLSAEFSAGDFERLSNIQPEMEETVGSLQLRAQLTPVSSSGQLDAVLEHLVRVGPQPEPRGDAPRVRDYTTQRIVNVARWPAEGCEAGDLPVPADGSLFEITPSEVLQRFATDVPLRWSDGSETLLVLAPSATGITCLTDRRPAWIEYYDYSPKEDDPALFGQPIELAIHTADGRFQATIQTHLQYEANKDGGLRHAWLLHYVSLPAGDAGGWSDLDPRDLATPRSWELRVSHEPAAPDADSGALTLRIRQETPPCKGMACLPPGVYVPLLRGELP